MIGSRLAWLLLALLLAGCLQATPPATPTPAGLVIRTPTSPAGFTPRPAQATEAAPTAAAPRGLPTPPPAPAGGIAVSAGIDASTPLRPISPLIYGLAWEDAELRAPLRRWGGNFSSRHNWELGSSFNAGSDWEFRNVEYAGPGERQPSGFIDAYYNGIRQQGTTMLLTIPAVGWVARDRNTETRSLNVPAQGGPTTGPAADGGQGRHGAIVGYDPSENRARTSLRSVARKGAPFQFPPDLNDNVVYQDEWVAHLVQRFGRAADGGIRFYAIDNEPDLWSVTHRDVHPAHVTYDSLLATFVEYATAIKEVDPTAEVVGPVVSGFLPLFFSAQDRGVDNFNTGPDRQAHGGQPLLVWFLQQMRQHDQQLGRRTLDVLAVNWYPQGGEYPDASDPETNARRLRATRQLWDATYRDESWISRTRDGASGVRLIPRLREWINQHYPGTKLGITEWNYGADDTLNGALAIADVLGIFGREGVDLAAYWRAPKPGSPGAMAFRLYRDYDGKGGQFGDQALAVQRTTDQTLHQVSIFASRSSQTNDVLVVLINKDERPAAVRLQLNGLPGQASVAQRFQYGAVNLGAIVAQPDQPLTAGQMTVELPGNGLTLLRIPSTSR